MKTRVKRILAIVMALTLVFALYTPSASADPFTAAQLGAAAYAIFDGWGIAFNTTNATAAGTSNFMSSQIEDYVNSQGGTIADVFVGQMAVDLTGKLVVAHDLYNSFIDFKDWLLDKFDLSDNDINIGNVAVDNQGNLIPIENIQNTESGIKSTGFSCVLGAPGADSPRGTFYCNGQSVAFYTESSSVSWGSTESWSVYYANNQWKAELHGKDNWGSSGLFRKGYLSGTALFSSPQQISWNGTSYTAPTVLNPDYEWTGTIGGYSEPDTNLDQLLGGIEQAVADNNLVVDAETAPIEPPQPTPTPIPIDPGTPLSNVPWSGVDNNMQELINQGHEENGLIGEMGNGIIGAIQNAATAVSSAIRNAIDDVLDIIDSIIEWLQRIYNKIQEGITNLSGILEDIFEAIQDIVESIVNADIEWFQNVVNAIWTPFLPILNIFKTGVGIWHYVVEWLQAIHGPFVTFWNFLSSAGYVFLTPIYATAAAAIVLAIYRRFGR